MSPERRALAAPDKFRGTITAREAAQAIAAGAARAGWTCEQLPLADGGEGTLDALGGANRLTRVAGPLGEPVDAGWRLDDATAVIEMARASGLDLAGGREHNDPLAASTHGTGELIAAAAGAGARTIVVAVGGSATTDGGRGALEALEGLIPFPAHGLDVRVACDVSTHFVDAARIFGPQKGASEDEVAELTARLDELASDYQARFGVRVDDLPRAGAAGGLAGGLAAAGASLQGGFDIVAGLVGLERSLAASHLIITGEGMLDDSSFTGKVVGGVCDLARLHGVDIFAVVGIAAEEFTSPITYLSLTARFGSEHALADTATCIAHIVEERLRNEPS
jgi:glycerate kinase